MHVEGFSKSLTNVGQPLRPRPQHPQGERGEPQGRGHPGGPDRHRLGPPARPAVRGADEVEARQHVHPVAGRADHEPEADRMARGEPARGEPDRAEVDRRRRAPGWRPRARATSPGASRRSTAPACRASWPTARRATRASPSSSLWRATPPAARPRTPGTRTRRPSCPSGARSSTSSGPGSTRCSRTPRSRR